MARIFSIQFTYEGIAQHAMVSVRTTPYFVEYSVAMLDELTARHLPNNKIIFTSGNFVFSDSTDENSPQLMQEIIQAITCRLRVTNA